MSTTKLEDFCQNPPFAISLPSLETYSYPTGDVAINPDYGTFSKINHIAISYINFHILIAYVDPT